MNENLSAPALKALREASRKVQAPEHIEINLRQAFRSHHSRRASRMRSWARVAIAASMLIAALITVLLATMVRPETPAVRSASMTPPPRALRKAPKAVQPEIRVARAPAVRRAVPQRDREVATDFFRIPYTPALTQMDRGQLIRVRVPATSMRNFGLPVREERVFDRVHADVLLGEDGIARAIRFIK